VVVDAQCDHQRDPTDREPDRLSDEVVPGRPVLVEGHHGRRRQVGMGYTMFALFCFEPQRSQKAQRENGKTLCSPCTLW
jgi:hypothetical protein